MNDPEAVDDLIADLMRVKPQTVLKWNREYGLKAVSVGARVRRYRKKDVRDFLLTSDDNDEYLRRLSLVVVPSNV